MGHYLTGSISHNLKKNNKIRTMNSTHHPPNTLVSRDRNPRERGFRPVNSDR